MPASRSHLGPVHLPFICHPWSPGWHHSGKARPLLCKTNSPGSSQVLVGPVGCLCGVYARPLWCGRSGWAFVWHADAADVFYLDVGCRAWLVQLLCDWRCYAGVLDCRVHTLTLHSEVWLLRHRSSQWSALLVPVQQLVLQHSSAQCGGFSTSVNATAGRLSCDCGGDR